MGRNQQVLLVDADIDHRAQLKQMLAGMAYAVVGEAAYGVEATRLAAELRPEIVLVHVEEPLALAFRTLEAVQQAAPSAAPVVVSRLGDGDTARKAMLAGARGLVVSPAANKEFDRVLGKAFERHQRTLRSAPDEAPESIAGVVVTVFGPKGGVGKTTLATNLAIGLRKHSGSRVALVDLDSYFGDVAVMMGAEPERTLADLVQRLHADPHVKPRDYLTPHRSGVDILAAAHSVDAGPQPSPEDITSIINGLAASYDFVVVDTPGAFSPLVAAALDESTVVLMITSADMASIKDARLSLDVLRGAEFDEDRLKLVVNHATNANSVGDSDLARTVDYDIFWSIPHDRAVPTSTQHGLPLLLSNPRAAMAQRVDSLAAYLSQAEPGGRRTGSSRRLGLSSLFSGRR